MKKSRYVLLLGSKNNSGDYLIRHRAIRLLERYRADRELVCLDRWKPLGEEELETINSSAALILAGGPALRKNMYPEIFPLVPDLDTIKVPMVLFGVGGNATWDESRGFKFDARTRKLLERIDKSGLSSSVRDYFALKALASNGFRRVLMTGCPALYSDEGEASAGLASQPERISFSPGTTFAKEQAADELQKKIILRCREDYPNAKLTVVFHHSLGAEAFREAYGGLGPRFQAQQQLAGWLSSEGIPYVDISGSHLQMIEHYSMCDFHVGFRVHAHVLMMSLRRPSILLAEDGRGVALRSVLGGTIFDSFRAEQKDGLFSSKTRKVTDSAVFDDVMDAFRYEVANGHPRARASWRSIDELGSVMRRFVAQLP